MKMSFRDGLSCVEIKIVSLCAVEMSGVDWTSSKGESVIDVGGV